MHKYCIVEFSLPPFIDVQPYTKFQKSLINKIPKSKKNIFTDEFSFSPQADVIIKAYYSV